MIKAVIFDCFGVLVNDALQGIVDELEKHDPETAKQIVRVVTSALENKISADNSRTIVASLLGLTMEGYRQRIQDGEAKNQALLDYILTLRPKYKTAVLSNILPGSLAVRFPDGELEKYFDVAVASGDVGVAKPDVRIYQLTAEKLGIAPNECVFIDDRQAYCDGAVATGMQAILYTSVVQVKAGLAALGIQPVRS